MSLICQAQGVWFKLVNGKLWLEDYALDIAK